MFEIGWTEMLVIAVVMIVVVGPKDLPKMLRTFGKMTAKMRGMAGDFQRQFNEALKEAELDDVKKSVDSLRSLNPASEIRKQLNPFEKAAADVRSGLDNAMKPKPAEPLKTGATGLPDAALDPLAEPPVFPAMDDPSPAAQSATPAAATPVKAAVPAEPVRPAVAAETPKPVEAKPAEPAAQAPVKPVAKKTVAAKPVKAVPAAKPAAAKPAAASKTVAKAAPKAKPAAKVAAVKADTTAAPAKAAKSKTATAKKKPAGSAA